MILKICLFSAFVIWALLEGLRDGHLFHYKSLTTTLKKVPHAWFTAHRLITGALVAYITQDWMFCLSLALMFPLFHNGMYYHTRHSLNPAIYPMDWKDHSTTSTAMVNFGFFTRVLMAQIGFVLLVVDLAIY